MESTYFEGRTHPAIDYCVRPADDAVAQLDEALASGRARLEFEPGSGYLPVAPADAENRSRYTEWRSSRKTSLLSERHQPHVTPPHSSCFNEQVFLGNPGPATACFHLKVG